MESPERFRVEVLFSPGAGHNPFEVIPIKQDHTLPIALRTPLHRGAPLKLLTIAYLNTGQSPGTGDLNRQQASLASHSKLQIDLPSHAGPETEAHAFCQSCYPP